MNGGRGSVEGGACRGEEGQHRVLCRQPAREPERRPQRSASQSEDPNAAETWRMKKRPSSTPLAQVRSSEGSLN